MNDNLLLGIVFAVVVLALYFFYRSSRRVQQRCPACQRFGHGELYGRYRCSACGAHFVLDTTGRPSRSVWDVVRAPLSILLLVVACLAVGLITNAEDLPNHPVVILLLLAFAGRELHTAFREKTFTQDGHPG